MEVVKEHAPIKGVVAARQRARRAKVSKETMAMTIGKTANGDTVSLSTRSAFSVIGTLVVVVASWTAVTIQTTANARANEQNAQTMAGMVETVQSLKACVQTLETSMVMKTADRWRKANDLHFMTTYSSLNGLEMPVHKRITGSQ